MPRFIVLIPCCLVSSFIGFEISKYAYYYDLMKAYNVCHPTKGTETYVARVDNDDFVCFQVNIDTKKINKYAIVMPE